MNKYLIGSAQTGKKIIDNFESFIFTNEGKTPQHNDSMLYSFKWKFNNQFGYASIVVNNHKISNSSLIDTDSKSPHRFARPLGLYNDNSLKDVFARMLNDVGVTTIGIYSDAF